MTDIKNRLDYNPETGEITWKYDGSKRPCWNTKHAGKVAGCISTNGYRVIRIDNKLLYGHRIAFMIMNGKWPSNWIDHIDGDESNNTWSNLREATVAENSLNRKRRKDNTTGCSGVKQTKTGRWEARIVEKNNRHFLGSFKTFEEAVEARKEGEKKYFKEWRRI